MQLELVAPARHQFVRRGLRARQRERLAAHRAAAGEADRVIDMRALGVVLGLDGLEADVGQHLHLGIAIADRGARDGRAQDLGHLERRAGAERPGVELVLRVPLGIDMAVDEIDELDPLGAEDQRESGDTRIDQPRFEKVRAAGEGWVGDGQPLRQELHVERIEVELEIAGDRHPTPRETTRIGFEGGLQEAPLGDEQHQPDQQDQPD